MILEPSDSGLNAMEKNMISNLNCDIDNKDLIQKFNNPNLNADDKNITLNFSDHKFKGDHKDVVSLLRSPSVQLTCLGFLYH